MAPNLTDNLVEYSFTPEESRAARILTPIQIAYYHTLRARYYKQKATAMIPDTVNLDRSYIQQICELEGKIGMISELLDNHETAMKEMNDPNKNEVDPNAVIDTLAVRAAAAVHNPPQT